MTLAGRPVSPGPLCRPRTPPHLPAGVSAQDGRGARGPGLRAPLLGDLCALSMSERCSLRGGSRPGSPPPAPLQLLLCLFPNIAGVLVLLKKQNKALLRVSVHLPPPGVPYVCQPPRSCPCRWACPLCAPEVEAWPLDHGLLRVARGPSPRPCVSGSPPEPLCGPFRGAGAARRRGACPQPRHLRHERGRGLSG